MLTMVLFTDPIVMLMDPMSTWVLKMICCTSFGGGNVGLTRFSISYPLPKNIALPSASASGLPRGAPAHLQGTLDGATLRVVFYDEIVRKDESVRIALQASVLP